LARSHADGLSQKMFEMVAADFVDLDIRETVCVELEALVGLQQCVILRQEGLTLYVGRKGGKMIYIPVKESSVFTQTTISKKVMVVNEASKDRATINEVRNWFSVTNKLQNLMIVPVGENKGKHGGALLVIMLNKFTTGDDGNPSFDNFNTTTSPACNKIF